MRLGLIVGIGVIAGILLARISREDRRVVVDARPQPTASRASTPQALWAGPVQTGGVRQLDLDATDARYDAYLLSKETDELSAKDIFEREPRDPAFAPTLEKRMSAALATAFRELDLEGKIVAIETECKTLSCYTRIEVSKEDGEQVYDAINGVMLGDVQAPGIDESDPERTYVTIVNLYRASTRDDAEYEKFLREATRPSLDAAKQRIEDARREDPR